MAFCALKNNDNLRKAYEVLNEEKNVDKALDLVSKQLEDTPDNVDALVLRMRIYQKQEDFGRTLADVNHAYTGGRVMPMPG